MPACPESLHPLRLLLVAPVLLAMPALAEEPVLRPSFSLIFKQPEMLQPGRCVIYQEGGSGWTAPVYYLKGVALAAEIRSRHLGHCPAPPGKSVEQYSREEFNRLALAYPCVAADVPTRDEPIGIIRLRVVDWETPHIRKAANAGRLYRGMLIERKLEKGMEIELEADLLDLCEP